ncbi:HU family DNA-binding protein (plasmid) [Roseomonas sp. OT10]|uniref:HU family DNA-binding protein n=1 Tax=Roseomonas cutis TaxID=2897332 RepID=UPI001E40F78A|nr:HU family DNA-binding protein [Roseomonas sp. OT10]UFN51736.1 HU family DNA-binding protein [Roseomonas sp. OT10]
MSKKFLTDVIQQSSGLTGVASGQVAADLIAAIKAEIVETRRFSLPDFGSFAVRETPKRSALNPRTGEKVAVKAGATVKFKAAPSLKEAAFAGVKKARRKAAKG